MPYLLRIYVIESQIMDWT